MASSVDPTLQRRLEDMSEQLCSRYGDRIGRQRIQAIFDDSLEQLSQSARVTEYVPALAYKFAGERLAAIARAQTPDVTDTINVVFVSLSGGGRGQLAAALTSALSAGRVAVHSAGTAAEGEEIDPGVRAVLEERGIDSSEEFVRPVTDEILGGASVIVTMGHSVGVIELPVGARHEDWRIGDPSGASVDEVRRVSEDIERRVRDLLGQLDVPVASA